MRTNETKAVGPCTIFRRGDDNMCAGCGLSAIVHPLEETPGTAGKYVQGAGRGLKLCREEASNLDCKAHVQAAIDRLHRTCGVIDTAAVSKALEFAWEAGRTSGSCSTAEAALERAGAAELENMRLRERVKALESRS